MAATDVANPIIDDGVQQPPLSLSLAPRGYLSIPGIIVLTGAVFLTGVGYLILEYAQTGRIRDSLFVSMPLCATMILLVGMRRIYQFVARRGVEFYAFVLASSNPQEAYAQHERVCRTVLNSGRMTICGLAYGAAVGFGSLLLGAWPDQPELRMALAVYLFAVNFSTGVGFYGLLSFFVLSSKMGRQARVDLWQTKNPSTDFLTGATRRVALLASVYVAICLSSILFSVLPIAGLTVAYSGFAGLVIACVLIVPLAPLSSKIRSAKRVALWELDERIQTAFFKTLADKTQVADDDLALLHSLLQLRERIEKIETWPFRLRALATGASIVFLSCVPVLLSIALQPLI